jgi:hypothetical protein
LIPSPAPPPTLSAAPPDLSGKRSQKDRTMALSPAARAVALEDDVRTPEWVPVDDAPTEPAS